MAKNVTKLYYPIKASIMSILPIVDEFVVALGDCDEDDTTREEIESIHSDKIKIIDTVWDIEKYPNGTENAHQTDMAKEHCSGDWLFYLQADEVIHEKYLPVIKKRCEQLLEDKEVEGLLFDYIHFWGDYYHYHVSRVWYSNEIRIIRNDKDIHSWVSAQSFRRIPSFDGKSYRQKKGTFKLKVAKVDASVYHYGWVRPPEYMQSKNRSLMTIHRGKSKTSKFYNNKPKHYDYGPLGLAKEFKGTHPEVMQEVIARFNWQDKLNYSKKYLDPTSEKHKHHQLKYRIATFLEQKLLGGKGLGSANYKLLRR